MPFPAATKNPLKMALNILKLRKLCLDEGVDILHARSRAPAWVALGAARSAKLAFITTYHGAYAGRSAAKVLYNSVMARGDVVIANSHYTAGLIASMHPFARAAVRVIHRGTDFSRFNAKEIAPARVAALRQAWGVRPDQRIILLAARLTAWKGQSVLIDAMHILRERGVTDAVVVLAGDPQGRDGYVRDLDRQAERLGLQGMVRRVGHCTDMPAAFLAASLVTVPSTEPEAFGRSAVEAQAMGSLVIVSDLGAVPETVLSPPQVMPQDRTGWHVPPKDAQALAEAMLEALSMTASAKAALSDRARQHVTAHFSLEAMTTATLDVYAAALERHKTPVAR